MDGCEAIRERRERKERKERLENKCEDVGDSMIEYEFTNSYISKLVFILR